MANDDGVALIAASFGVGAAAGVPAAETADMALAFAGMPRRVPKQPIYPFNIPPAAMTATAVGSFLFLPDQMGPSAGWFWDITSLTITGFSAGVIAVTKAGPAVDSAGNPIAVEYVASFNVAGTQNFPQRGNPLLDSNESLIFTVTGTMTGVARITGTAMMVPVSRVDEYVS